MNGERRRGGRPPAEEPSATVSTWLPASAHDRLIRIANEREESVSECVRKIVIEHIAPDDE
jgi:hypothetical protein